MRARRLAGMALVAASVALNLTLLGLRLFGPSDHAGDTGPLRRGEGPLSAGLADQLRLDAAGRTRLETLRAPVVARRAALAEEAGALRAEMIEAIVAGDAPGAEAARARLVERQVAFQHEVVVYLATLGAELDASRRESLRAFLRAGLFPGLGGARGPCPGCADH